MSSMSSKVCIVTGGAGGIGRASALKFASNGAKAVVIADVNEAGAQETVALIEAAGGTASVKVTDLQVPQQIEELVDYTVDTYGGLDTLLNNAAVHEFFWTDQTSVDKLPLEHLDSVYQVNLRAVFALTQAAVPHLRVSKNDPNIVNAASMVGFLGFPASTAYSCMKAALMQFTRVAAVDLSPEIRVNAFAPGNVDTPMVDKILSIISPDDDPVEAKAAMTATHLVPRLGKAEDIANLVGFLASTDAGWITGVSYVIDGGTLAWRGTH
jgi:NAD(P)-dependent dehydrogenase (short-subunit alcohol dehydrogenase family)